MPKPQTPSVPVLKPGSHLKEEHGVDVYPAKVVKEIEVGNTRHVVFYDANGVLSISTIKQTKRSEYVETLKHGDVKFMSKVRTVAKYWPGIKKLPLIYVF